jgi:translation initiation factor 2 alpha subunit (eIF-2alpha)
VRVERIVENGAYVLLLEYDDIEGLITPNEYTRVIKFYYRHT